MTKELKARGGPVPCGEKGSGAGKDFPKETTSGNRCVSFDDYGVGSYDSTKSNYCVSYGYVLILYPESAAAWQLYRMTRSSDPIGTRHGVIAIFDANGKPTTTTTTADTTTTTTTTTTTATATATATGADSQQIPGEPLEPGASGAAPKTPADPIAKGIGDLIKKITGR